MSFETDKSGAISYHIEHEAIVNAASSKVAEPTSTHTVSEQDEDNGDKVAEWVENPYEILDQIEEVTLIHPIIEWKARALYSGGLIWVVRSIDDEGKETFKPIMDEEIEQWMEDTDVTAYIEEASDYFYTFWNVFPELIVSRDHKTITGINCLETTDCKWALRTLEGDNQGLIETCYVSAKWNDGATADDETTIPLPVIQTKRKPIEWVENNTEAKNWIYPLSHPSPGRRYYQRAPWFSLLKTWLPVAKAVPEFKQAMMKNQATIKYVVTIPEWWWRWKYPDWDKKPKLIKKRVEDEHKTFNDFVSGKENAGKSIITILKDPDHSKEYKGWDVDVLDNKHKEGIYIEDSQEADAHIFKNFTLDPTLFGSGPGKNTTSAGSGSDKRVAWNLYQLMLKSHQDLILKPLKFIARYNGWVKRIPGLMPMFRNYLIATLDEGKEVSKKEE